MLTVEGGGEGGAFATMETGAAGATGGGGAARISLFVGKGNRSDVLVSMGAGAEGRGAGGGKGSGYGVRIVVGG